MVISVAQRLDRFSVLIGVALVVSACGGGGGDSSGSSSNNPVATPVSTIEPDRLVLEVQPIQVCDDGGIVCAQVEFSVPESSPSFLTWLWLVPLGRQVYRRVRQST
ncbi:MAG: hypothetical protein AAGA46_12165 [Cyanobacteria bacterium P01_F01_bin.13]